MTREESKHYAKVVGQHKTAVGREMFDRLPPQYVTNLEKAMAEEYRLNVPTKYSELTDFHLTNYMDCFDDTPGFWTTVSWRARMSNAFIKAHNDKLNMLIISIIRQHVKEYRSKVVYPE